MLSFPLYAVYMADDGRGRNMPYPPAPDYGLLCEKHGGEMEIAGEPGQGAVVKAVFGTGSRGNSEVRTANIPSIYPKTGGKTQNY